MEDEDHTIINNKTMSDTLLTNICFRASGNEGFPCNSGAIELVAFGLAAGAVSLVMVIYLMKKVGICVMPPMPFTFCCSSRLCTDLQWENAQWMLPTQVLQLLNFVSQTDCNQL